MLRARWYLRNATVLGQRVRVWGRPIVRNLGTLLVGERTRLVSTAATVELAVEVGGTLEIGAGTFINYGCSIGASQLVRIGPRCRIGTHAILIDNDYHRIEPERRDERPPSRPIVLEENVWLGARVIVLRGVTIGEHSVVGTRSLVTGDVPPHSLAYGLPARVQGVVGDRGRAR